MHGSTTNSDYTPRESISPTEQRILDCAIESLATRGYTQTTIGEISRQLGVSKGVINYHFSSKEVLFQEIVASVYATARGYMSANIEASDNAWGQIHTFIDMSCSLYQEYSSHIKALQEIRANFQPKQHISLARTLYEKELVDLETVFISGQNDGVFRDFDPKVAALTLRFALNGAAESLYTDPSHDIQKHAQELIGIFGRAFCK